MGVGQKTDPKPPPSAAGPGALWLGSPSPEAPKQDSYALPIILPVFCLAKFLKIVCNLYRCFMICFFNYWDATWFLGDLLFRIASAITSNLKFTGHKSHQTKGWRSQSTNVPTSSFSQNPSTLHNFFQKWNHTEKTEIFNKSNPFSDWKHTHPKTKNATKSYYTEQRTNNVEKIWWIKFHNKRP